MDYYEEVTAKNVALKFLVSEAIEMLEADLEGLRNGVSVNGLLSGLAEDAETISEINRIVLWIARAKIELRMVGAK